MTDRFSIGFLGDGPVTQAIHLPVREAIGNQWRVAKVMDVIEDAARIVARRCDAEAVTDALAILDDPAIDVAGICSTMPFYHRGLHASWLGLHERLEDGADQSAITAEPIWLLCPIWAAP